MENAILNPVSIYRYKRHVAPDGRKGTRWDYVGHEGQEYPDGTIPSTRVGKRVIIPTSFIQKLETKSTEAK